MIEEFGGEEGCPCNKLRVYTEDGIICFPDGHTDTQFEGFNVGPLLVMECGPSCRYDSSCRKRGSQRSLAVRVAVVRHSRNGWILHSLESIRKGAFVCEYAEYAYSMEVTEKGDIYSFGVVLLELVTGKQPIQPLDQGGDLVTYARRLFQRPAATSIMFDERMDLSQKVVDEMELVLKIAFFCTSASPFERPTMQEVVSMLIESRENSVSIVSSPTSETALHMT